MEFNYQLNRINEGGAAAGRPELIIL